MSNGQDAPRPTSQASETPAIGPTHDGDLPVSDVQDALGARIAAAVQEELASMLGADVSREVLTEALGRAGGSALPMEPVALQALVEGDLAATLASRLGDDVAREALDLLRPLLGAWARIDEHRRSERPTSRPRPIAPSTWWIVLGPERAWAVDRLAEELGEAHHVVLANEPADLDAFAAQGATRALLLLDRAQRWAGRLVYPPQWTTVLAPSRPDESLDELAAAVRRLCASR